MNTKLIEKECNKEFIALEERIWDLLIEYDLYSEEERYSVDVDNISYENFLKRSVELAIAQDDVLTYYLAYENLRISLKEVREAEYQNLKIVEIFI